MPRGSSSTITRLKATWWDDYEAWRKRDLKSKRYVYIWADGVYFTPRLDGDRQCMLVIIGADEYGEKDVLAIADGFRENADSWNDLLKGLKKRGLTEPPELAIGDGAIGFWTALREAFPGTHEQRCWVHKELWLNLGDAHHQAARFSVSAETSTPSLNLIPSMTFGNWFLPLRRSHFFDAA